MFAWTSTSDISCNLQTRWTQGSKRGPPEQSTRNFRYQQPAGYKAGRRLCGSWLPDPGKTNHSVSFGDPKAVRIQVFTSLCSEHNNTNRRIGTGLRSAWSHNCSQKTRLRKLGERNSYGFFSLMKKPSDTLSGPEPPKHQVILGLGELAWQGKRINESTRNVLNTSYAPNLCQVTQLKGKTGCSEREPYRLCQYWPSLIFL